MCVELDSNIIMHSADRLEASNSLEICLRIRVAYK